MVRTRKDLEAAAIAAGARLVATRLVRRRDGSLTLAGDFEFEDPWAAARLLDILAEQDADDPMVRAWAWSIRNAVARYYQTSPDDPRILDAFAQAVHASVQESIAFEPEEGERFQSADTTIIEGVGDCDCHARLVHALARSQGLGSALRYFGDEEPTHAVAALATSSGPAWAETTIAAEFGEHPQEAYRRLGLHRLETRPDIGFLGLEFVTPGNVEDRKVELDGYIQAINADVAACPNLDPSVRAAWVSFVASWHVFTGNRSGWLDSGAQGRQAAEFAETIRQWQTKLAPICSSSTPSLPAAVEDQTVSVIKAGAIAVGVVAGAVVVVKAIDLLAPAVRRRRAA